MSVSGGSVPVSVSENWMGELEGGGRDGVPCSHLQTIVSSEYSASAHALFGVLQAASQRSEFREVLGDLFVASFGGAQNELMETFDKMVQRAVAQLQYEDSLQVCMSACCACRLVPL